mgnify:CR=1 FL=1|tara:strand:+ start:423 stop:1448 length:1026 start_codon:yes stop_codon:yes gene_type:complete
MKVVNVHGANLGKLKYNLKFDSGDVLLIYDVFDDNSLTDLLLKIDTPKYIVNDHFSFIKIPNLLIHTIPRFLGAVTERNFFQQLPVIDAITPTNDTIFNFIINKKQINRFLCIKLVEFFKLSNFNYTWSGVDNHFDMSGIIKELDALGNNAPFDENTRFKILTPINLEPKFFDSKKSKIIANTCVHDYGGNKWTWNNGLNNVFGQSAVSLITESLRYQKGAVFTEKTAYSVMGLTFPIWIGGYQQAQAFEKIGFDVFNDIVDHSYQHYDTLIERCYYAFEKNLQLLTDQNYTYNLRNLCMDRLKNNFELLRNFQTQKFCKEQIGTWPEDLQMLIKPYLLRI